jgi:hypothetical protein
VHQISSRPDQTSKFPILSPFMVLFKVLNGQKLIYEGFHKALRASLGFRRWALRDLRKLRVSAGEV